MSKLDIKDLFAAGAHFGHRTSRWHPKMAPYIHGDRGGIHIIDLVKTVEMLDPALAELQKIVANGRQVLFVSTKQQARQPILDIAEANSMPYIVNRWMGGLLTNFKTITARIKQLADLEQKMESGELAQRYSKLEVQRYQEEIDALNFKFGGIKDMPGLPGAVFVVDIRRDSIAVKEAKRLGIPVFALVDSNNDPSDVDFVIPCNDDAIAAIELIFKHVSEAIASGKAKQKTAKVDDKPVAEKTAEAKPAKKTDDTPAKKPAAKPEAKKAPAKKASKPAAKKTTTKKA